MHEYIKVLALRGCHQPGTDYHGPGGGDAQVVQAGAGFVGNQGQCQIDL